MEKLRTNFNGLTFWTKYMLSYIWTAVALIAILIGVKINWAYLIIVPIISFSMLIVLKKKFTIVTKIIMLMYLIFTTIDIITQDISIGTILLLEVVIIIIGPAFFVERAK